MALITQGTNEIVRTRRTLSSLFVLQVLLTCIVWLPSSSVHAQAAPAATKGGAELQAGASFDLAGSDFKTGTLRGFGFYSTFDFRPHLGMEVDFHQLNDPDSKEGVYERSYEIGPRYFIRFGPFKPYAKFLVGRGVFNFPPDPVHPEKGAAANLAYTIWSGGFGTDYRLKPSMNLRLDYELQRWPGFPPNGISPSVFSLGVAYHFH